MKTLVGIVLGLACGVGLWLFVEMRAAPRSTAPTEALAPTQDDMRLRDIERKLSSLDNELQRLSMEVARNGGSARSEATTTFVAPAEAARRSGDGLDPRWYLEQYVHSFDAGGDGSEYFRLAVDAYAPILLNEICDLVRGKYVNDTLRIKLAAMLGTPQFTRDTVAIDALLAMLREATADRVAIAGLDALKPIGDAATGVMLERLIWGLPSLDVMKRTLGVITQLDGPDANRALQRLFGSATSTNQRKLVLAALSTADPDAALDLLRQASLVEDEVRLQAALAIHKFRGEAFLAFIDQWLGYEQDAHVRQVLGEARARMSQIQPYAAQKATGAPDAEPNQDHPNAWASQSADMGDQWLEVRYKLPRRASGVRIHEVNIAGAVTRVFLVDESGMRHQIWSGVDPTKTPGVFEITFAATSYRVKGVRIELDTNRNPGWSEIDAVELTGPDGNAWADDATASSSYGQ